MKTRVTALLSREPVRVYLYGALVALLPLLAAFGVDLTDAQTLAVGGFGYAVLIGGAEAARANVSPV
jgi:hypothetical protein